MNIVLDTNCLIMSIARCIVSEDKHFNVLKIVAFPKIDVIGINDFMDIFGKHLN